MPPQKKFKWKIQLGGAEIKRNLCNLLGKYAGYQKGQILWGYNILLDLKEIPLYAFSPCSLYGHSMVFI